MQRKMIAFCTYFKGRANRIHCRSNVCSESHRRVKMTLKTFALNKNLRISGRLPLSEVGKTVGGHWFGRNIWSFPVLDM